MKFKLGELVIVDPNNTCNMMYNECMFGKIKGKIGDNQYLVDILKYDNVKADYVVDSSVTLSSELLGKIGEGNVIRNYPTNTIINTKDVIAIGNIILMYDESGKIRYEDINRLRILLNKILHFNNLFNPQKGEREDDDTGESYNF